MQLQLNGAPCDVHFMRLCVQLCDWADTNALRTSDWQSLFAKLIFTLDFPFVKFASPL